MRLCLPTLDAHGREGRLSPHFGSAPYFTLVDSDADTVEVVANRRSAHQPGSCEAVRALGGRPIDAVVCGGMGRRAFQGLRAAGIDVFVTSDERVGNAVAAFHDGRLFPLSVEEACGGGRHGGHCS